MLEQRVAVEHDLIGPEIGGAGRDHQVLVLKRRDHVARRQLLVAEAFGIEVDEDGAVLAADDHGIHRPLDFAQHVADVNAGHVLDLGLAQRGIADREYTQRQRAGRVEGEHHRRQGVGRQRGQGPQGQRVRERQRPVRVDVVAEVDLDDAHAGHRPRLDDLGTRRLVDPALDAVGDGLLDGRGRHALVVGQHLDGRRLEHRQDVDRDVEHGEEAEDHHHEDERGHHVWVSQRRLDEPHR